MMNESVHLSLLSMGFDEDQCRRAAIKFDNPESAINWVLEGAVDDPVPSITTHSSQPSTTNPNQTSLYHSTPTPTPTQTSNPRPLSTSTRPPTRTTTPYPPPSPPSTPSPTVSDLGDGNVRGNAWGRQGELGLAQNLQRGLTEEEALAEAIRLSQEETSYPYPHPHSHSQQPPPSQPRPSTQTPQERKYNPPRGNPPTLRLRPPPPPPPPLPLLSTTTSGRPRPPPPPPPPLATGTERSLMERRTRSPTPGPPELGKQNGPGETSARIVPPQNVVVGSKNPFRSAMQPGSESISGLEGGSVGGGESAGQKGLLSTHDRNVRFKGEDIIPPNLLPPWSKELGASSGGIGMSGGAGGDPSFAGSQGQVAQGDGLRKVSDDVEDQDGSRGMVLVPSTREGGVDAMAVDPPAGSSQIDRQYPTTSTTPSGASPPPMDTYPIDRDEEQLALERAIKLSLSSNTNHIRSGGTSIKDSDENTVEGVVTGAAEYDMVLDEETTRMAMAEVVDWRRDEDETDFSVIREPGAPLAVRSRTENTVWSAHIVQALISVPAVRRAIEAIDPENLDPVVFGQQIHRDVVDFMKQLLDKHDKPEISETVVTAKLDHFGLRGGPIAIGQRAYDMLKLFAPAMDHLPTVPIVTPKESLEPETIDVGMSDGDQPTVNEPVPETEVTSKQEGSNAMEQEPELGAAGESPRRLFTSEMRRRDEPATDQNYDHCWMIPHDPRTDKTVSDAISNAQKTWRPNHLFSSLSQVFCLGMGKADRIPGETGGEALVGLEEALYLDRFLIENADKVDTLTTRQTELRASIETRKNEMQDLVKHKGQDIDKMIERTIRYFDEIYEMEGSQEASLVVKNATITQLQAVKSKLDEKRTVLSAALEAEETELSGLWNEPDLKLNKYDLQAVCFNSGWSGMNAIRSYIKGNDGQWWRIQESVVEKVTFDDLATDNWGMMFDQGPYFLIYTRDCDNDDRRPEQKVSGVGERPVEPIEMRLEEDETMREAKPFQGVDVGLEESGMKEDVELKVHM